MRSVGGYRGVLVALLPVLAGPFEDDPNLTNKRSPGNPTKSYSTSDPLRIVDLVEDWQEHHSEVLQGMLESLADRGAVWPLLRISSLLPNNSFKSTPLRGAA